MCDGGGREPVIRLLETQTDAIVKDGLMHAQETPKDLEGVEGLIRFGRTQSLRGACPENWHVRR